MQEAEQVSLLIGDIYDASLDPSLWTGVLKAAAGFVRGSAASLYAKDAINKNGNIFYTCGGIPQHYVQLYFDKYVKLDPSTTGHFCAEIEEPIATADLIPYGEFLETRFYKEWARPQRLVDHVAAVLDKSATGMALFGVFRHERDGVVDDEARRRMRLIVPHIRRAVLIGRVIDLRTVEAATFADVLDNIAAGMFLVDAKARIVHANAAGHAILAAGDILRGTGGRLVARDGQIDETLRDIFAALGGGEAALGARGIALPLISPQGERYVAHVLPLTSGSRRRAGAAAAAVAGLFVHKTALEVPSPLEVIAKAFKLTPGELRVLLAVVEVGVPEAAEALGVAETTVKTHLSRVFEKTGTHRQADLVKLVTGFASPLLS